MVFAVSAALGAAIWALSPPVTGAVEPWDADSWYYVAALLAAGFAAGCLFPRNVWPVLPGIALGQFVYMLLFLPAGPLIGVGFVILFVYGVLALAAAWLGSALRRLWPESGEGSGTRA